MILVAGLVFAGVFVGWIVGHYATPGHTKTVTVAAGGGTSPSAARGDREGAELLGGGPLSARRRTAGRRWAAA